MKLETFFEKFELFAEAPNSVERMRELILELAVRGKLIEQEDHLSPAIESLDPETNKKTQSRIESETEALFSIPQSWKWTRLADLGDTNPRNSAKDSEKSSFVPMALISAEYGKKNSHQERPWGEIKKGYTHFMNGDVVMAKITPCFENGKSCVISDLTGGFGAGTTELHVFRPAKSKVIPEYAIIYLKTRGFIERGIPKMTGSAGQKRIPSNYFAESSFPLPPLSEQNRIVAKTDELMALCDRLEAQQQEREAQRAKIARASLTRFTEAPTPANLASLFHPSCAITPTDLRKSILELAVQGKLVAQDHNDKAADELIANIERERVQLAKEQDVRIPKNIPPLNIDDHPHEIPNSWRWSRIGHIALVIDYGTSEKAGSDSSKVPVYRMGNIVHGRLIDENLKYVDATIDDLPGLYLKTSDILFNRTNSYELVGKTCIYMGPNDKATFASYLIRIRLPKTMLFPSFFSVAMNAPYYRQTQIEPEIVQQCGQANFNGTKLAATLVPVPPLAEQRRIVAKVDELMALVDQLESQLGRAKADSTTLLNAAIHELLNPREQAAVDRSGIGCHVVHRLGDRKTFGRTALAKFAYLAETHVGLEFNGQYLREAAGPLDPWIYRFEEEAAREHWFTSDNTSIRDGNRKIVYRKGDALEEKASEAVAALPQSQRDELDRILKLLGGKPTEEIEIIATLFAVWNDFLIDGHSPSDEDIVTGFREQWHEKKQKFAAKSLHAWLDWMRRNDLVPTGRGPRTQQHAKLDLH